MTLFDFIRLVYRNFNWLFFIPASLGVLVFFLTMNQPKEYGVSSLVYTGIASGYNIESGEGDKVDYHSVNNAFDNLITIVKSQQTFEEVGLRLLSQHLTLTQSDPKLINKQNFDLLQEAFPTEERSIYSVAGSVDSTYQLLADRYLNNDKKLVDILRTNNTPYSIKRLSGIDVKRHKSSDMLALYFSSDDPGITQQTMLLFIEVFSRRYKQIKDGETGDVVAYFEKELMNAKGKLNTAEDKLTDFRVNSRVINYGEQTKAIAIKKQNALEEFSSKNMNLQATKSAVLAIEQRLKVREDILAKNADILESKKRLEELTTQIALIESSGEDSLLSAYLAEQKEVKQAIENDLSTLYNFSNSKEGLPSKQLLNDWLNNVIQLNREKVNVNLYKKRLEDIDQMYDHFAPLGSTIARLEREINVFEQTYLQILHGLNMAKLRQQNIEMMSNLEVIDWPRYPHEPKPGKRMLLLVVAVLVGFMGTLSVLVAGDLLDNTLKNPKKAVKATRLELAGAYPVMNQEYNEKYPFITTRLSGLLASKVKLERSMAEGNDQSLIVFFSMTAGEGKSTTAKMLFDELQHAGEKVALITSNKELRDEEHGVFSFDEQATLTGVNAVDQLVPGVDWSAYDNVLLEIPPLSLGQIPIELIKQASLSLMVARADKSWSPAHRYMIDNYTKLTNQQPKLILNGVKLYHLDQVLGELPLERSSVAQWVRKMVKFEFNKSSLNAF